MEVMCFTLIYPTNNMIHIDPISKHVAPPYVNIFIKQEELPHVVELLLQTNVPFIVSHQPNDLNEPAPSSYDTTDQANIEDLLYAMELSSKSQEEHIKRLFSLKKEIEQIIDYYLSIGEEPNLEVVAQRLNFKLSVFKTHFKDAYGKPFYQFYIDKKMEYAAELLRKGIKGAQVSLQVGYSHPIKFNKMFQKHFGVTPKKYQEALSIY